MNYNKLNEKLFANNIPHGTTITKIKDNSNTGIIFIMGSADDDDYNILPDLSPIFTINDIGKGQFKETFNGQPLKASMMYINIHGINMPLKDLGNTIASFSENYENIHIISALHGFVVDPFKKTHKVKYFNKLHDSINHELLNYFTDYISTEYYLQTLADSVDKPFSLWLSSCQGEKMIEAAQEILPKGSTFITESDGYIMNSYSWGEYLKQTLYGDNTFSVDKLLNTYLTPSITGCPLSLFNLHPVKTIIGKSSVVLDKAADLFVNDLKDDQIKKDTLTKIIETVCLDNIDKDSCTKVAYKTIDLLHNSHNSISNCYTHIGENSYLFNKDPDDWCSVPPNSSCELSDGENYLMALAIGNAYQNINESCLENAY
jgi:hypothetical protein